MKNRLMNINVLLLLLIVAILPPGQATPINPEAQKIYEEAEAQFKGGNLDQAIDLLQQALMKEPDNGVYRFVLGNLLSQKGNPLAAKEHYEIVSRTRPSPDKGDDYNKRLKAFKKSVKTKQDVFNEAGKKKFDTYEKNQNSPKKVLLAQTLFEAFRLNPPLRYKNFEKLNWATKTYEEALQASIQGQNWQKEPMLQLAFLYEIANKKDKAAEVYMRALDYVENPNEEFIITHKFDYLNRSNKEKLLDTIEAGEFTQKDLEELMGSNSAEVTEGDRKKIDDMISEARSKLEDATTDEEREQVLEEIKASIIEKQKRGELPGQDKLKKKLEKEGKSLEQYMKEKGF